MEHPCALAAKHLRGKIAMMVADINVKPGSQAWFEMQAMSFGLSMLRKMMETGSHNDPVAAEVFRNYWRMHWVPEELVQEETKQ